MPLNTQGELAAAELAFFSISFLLVVAILIARGFKGNTAWLYLGVLSVLRIVGNACLIYSQLNNDYSHGLIEVSSITNAVGTAPLLLSTIAFLQGISQSMSTQRISAHAWHVGHIITMLVLALAVVGGILASSTNSSHATLGKHLAEASSILFLLILLILIGATLLVDSSFHEIVSQQKKLAIGIPLALPFILVKVVYVICTAFAQPGSSFYAYSSTPDVWLMAFLSFLPEAMVVVIYFIFGMLSKNVAPSQEQAWTKQDAASEQSFGYEQHAPQGGYYMQQRGARRV